MPSLKTFRQMSGLPDTIRRWSDAAEQVKRGQQALAELARNVEPASHATSGGWRKGAGAGALDNRLAAQSQPSPDTWVSGADSRERPAPDTEAPMDWHPQVHREHAEADGRKPEDFQFEQWPLSNVRIEASTSRHAAFWYNCDLAPGTPLDNQYDDAGNKKPDPVGMCLQSIEFRLMAPGTGAKLDEKPGLPADGGVRTPPTSRGGELWNRLTPGTSLKVKLVALPDFYFLNEQGGMVGYANTSDGQFKGKEVESKGYTLSMDHDGNVRVE